MQYVYRLRGWLVGIGLLLGAVLTAQAQCPAAASCTPGPASAPSAAAFGMGIFNVMLGTLNNTTAGVTDGYQDYSCTTGTTLSPGASYPISIRTNANADENVRVWLDLNNDGQFNATTELLFSSSNARLHTGTTVVIPATAVLGQPLRLRVAADAATSPVPTPCSTPQYSQTEDYRVTLQVNTQKPAPAFAVGTAGACAGTYTFQDQSTQGPTSWRWSFGDGTFSTQQHPSHTYAQPGTYDVRLRVCNTNGCDSLLKPDVLQFYGTNPAPASCQPVATAACCGFGLTQVTIGSLTNTSADATAGYENFSCTHRITVTQAEPVALSLRGGTTSTQDYWLYLDLNNDGQFTANELVWWALNTSNPETAFVVPAGALLNQPLRLRLVADQPGGPGGACAPLARGQAEDYSLVVTPAPCNTPPSVGTINFRDHRVLPGYDVRCVMMAGNVSPNAYVQWQESPTNVNPPTWQDIPNATLPAYTAVVGTGTSRLYRPVVRCGTATVTPLQSLQVPSPYPQAGSYHNPCGTAAHIQAVELEGTTLNTVSGCANTHGNAYTFYDPTVPRHTATLRRGETYRLRVTTSKACRVLVYFTGLNGDSGMAGAVISIARTAAGVPTSFLLPVDSTRLTSGTAMLGIRCDEESLPDNQIGTDVFLAKGETENYLLRVLPWGCAEPTAAGLITAPTQALCPEETAELSVFGQSLGARLQWQVSADSLTWQDVAGATARILRRPMLATAFFRVRVQGCSAATTLYTPAVKVRVQSHLACYCTAPAGAGAAATTPLLTRVRVRGTTLDNASAATSGPAHVTYAPTAPAQTATLVRGATYVLELTLASPLTSPAATSVTAWLDLNQNGRYDSLEWMPLVRVPTAVGTATYQAQLTVPHRALPGLTGLRLRTTVGAEFRAYEACTPARQATGVGETEDYQVTIVDAPCLAPLAAGTIEWPQPAACATVLRARGFTLGATLQWQRSIDQGSTWADVPGQTEDQLELRVVARPTAEQYRVRVQCGGAAAHTPAVTVPVSYCTCLGAGAGGGSQSAYPNYLDSFELLGTPLATYGTGVRLTQGGRTSRSAHATPSPWLAHQTAALGRGTTYTVRLTAVATDPLYGAAWADWNHDGTLSAAECLGTFSFNTVFGAPQTASYNLSLPVPTTAALGPTVVRARVWQATPLLPTDGCVGLTNSSETEDYLVTVVAQPGPTLPTLVASLCAGSPLRLQATGAGAGAAYRWLGPNGFQATGDLVAHPGFTAADAGTYVAVAELNGQQIVTSLYVPPTPACVPLAARTAAVASALSIFPNPTTGLCTLRVPASGPRPTRLRLHTATGQLVHEQAVTSRSTAGAQEVPLDLRRLPRGLYFVELQTGQGSQYGKVVVE